jgi:hypothetical protein
MINVLKKILSKWTFSLSENEARKKIFTNIRDMEYHISPGYFYTKNSLSRVLKEGKGFCLSKHYLLGELLELSGYEVKYCTYEFNWDKIDVDFPENISELVKELPLTYHVACRVFMEGRWVLLDATWDKNLREKGFPVNKWDGVSDTVLAVRAIGSFQHKGIEKHQIFYHSRMKNYTLKEKLMLARFTRLFNLWLARIRRGD